MAKVNEKYVLNSSSESEVDTSESEVDLSDDDMEGQKIKPEINGKTSSDNNSSVFLKSNNKLQATTSSSKTAAATNSKPQNIKFVETSSSSEDVSDSSEDEMVQMKSDIKNNINGKQSSTNIPKIIGVGSIPPKIAPKQPVSINKTSSEDESDSDETFSSDDDEITVPRQKQKVNNKAAVQNFSKLNIVKTDETSEDTSDTSDSESDKTSSSDEDDDDNDASDEEEDETDDSESVVVESKNAAQILKKPAPNTVTLPQSKTTLTKFNNDETDEDYTSTEESEDEVFVKKPLTTKPFQTDSDSDSDEDPDYSDNSSEDDNIPIKKNDQASSTKAIIPPKVTTNMAPPKPPPRVTIPFQNPFSSIRATSQIAPTTIKQQTRKTQQQPPLEDNLLLNALRQFSLNLNNPVERQKELARRAEEAFRRNELTFVCCVCMENFYRDANFAKCKKLNGEKIKVDHYICITCLRGTATPENAGIAPDGSGLKCPFPECPNILLMSEIRGMIDAGIESNLLELIGRMSFASADIGILVTCPKCQKQWVVEDKGKASYICECQRKNCLFCEREYDKFHEGRNCQEAAATAALENKNKKQNEVALEMNNIVVRQCHKCGTQFVKSDGCNKMTCRCKATQCYICRERDIDYGHFGGPCQLYDNAEEYDQRRLDEVIAKNKNAIL